MPMRVDGDLFGAAKSVAASSSRSAAQQFNHWARIGRELESSPGVSVRDIQNVLAGRTSYDAVGERDQAVVRAIWDERIAEQRAGLDLESEFTKADRTWTEADTQGNTVARGRDGAIETRPSNAGS